MRPPDTYAGLLALVLGALGAVFTLLGLVGEAVAIPMRGGQASDFLPFGLTFLLAGGVCLCADRRKKAARARLLAEGRRVEGRIIAVKHHLFVTFNTRDFINFPGRHSPWTILCAYTWAGQHYAVRSPFLWQEPIEGKPVDIYLDPARPKRAAVDPDSVPQALQP